MPSSFQGGNNSETSLAIRYSPHRSLNPTGNYVKDHKRGMGTNTIASTNSFSQLHVASQQNIYSHTRKSSNKYLTHTQF